jgi:hypothetical protein
VAWLKELARVSADLARKNADNVRQLATALCVLDQLMITAPVSVLDGYRRLDESALAFGAERVSEQLEKGTIWTAPAGSCDDQAWAFVLGSHIRALDEALMLWSARGGPPCAAETEWLSPDGHAFIIPVNSGRGVRGAPAHGHTYLRRGTLHHRIIPTIVNGLRVRIAHVEAFEDHDRSALEPLQFGAALLPKLHLELDRLEEDRFLILNASFEDAPRTLREQVRQAGEKKCHLVVWTELVFTPGHRRDLAAALAAASFELDSRLQFVMAGSIHEQADDGFRNSVIVLDATGKVCGEYAKVIPYFDKDVGEEAIQPGSEFLLIVTEGSVFAVGICKDFCDAGVPPAYFELPLDFVLVSSLAEESTMKAHQAAAHALRARSGERTFVVQQDLPQDLSLHEAPAGALGYVLPPLEKPMSMAPAALLVHEPFTAHTCLCPG